MLKHIEAIRLAAHAATIAHRNQKRKNERTPYIVHPATVSQLVLLYDNECYLGVISAWMHDVLEDCGEEGVNIFDALIIDLRTNDLLTNDECHRVMDAVEALTKNDDIHPRSAKMADCVDRLVDPSTPRFAVLVKICDRIDNLMDMDGFKPGFVRTYMSETDQLIEGFKALYHSANAHELIALRDLMELRDIIVQRENL